uniref:Sperm tail PG-rich repeat containing 1 n=1 Tax=Ornithorhynchus anatinus TaxID=9258 RepID=A0A6I8N2H0_ORNAN
MSKWGWSRSLSHMGFTVLIPILQVRELRHREQSPGKPKAFSSQRVPSPPQDENPGPGSYDVVHRSPEFNSVSLSKKGTGSFPSLVRGVPKFPAANAYSLPSGLISKCDFSNAYSSMFQLPFCVKVPKLPTPAPNQYNASLSFCKQQNNVSARAVFLSKTQRGLKEGTERAPAPGSYEINESLVTESPKTLKSFFQSRTRREFKVASLSPGPAAYCPSGPLQAPRRAPGLLNFSAPALALPPQPPLPGPGQYEIVDFSGPPKQDISSAVFVSGTRRWAGPPGRGTIPGPGERTIVDTSSVGKPSPEGKRVQPDLYSPQRLVQCPAHSKPL